MSMLASLATVPFEILEHIAYYAATNKLEGPPTDLNALSQVSQTFYQTLSFQHNPSFYARLFPSKFDIAAPIRRLGPHIVDVQHAAKEFRSRFEALQRFRLGKGSQALSRDIHSQEGDLWIALLMMIENDGKNGVQLQEYGRLVLWLRKFFLDSNGGSYARHDMTFNNWPRDNLVNKLAVWLICLYDSETDNPDSSLNDIIRIYSVNALKYPLTDHLWFNITLPCDDGTQKCVSHFGENHIIQLPSIATPAILSHMSRITPILKTFVNRNISNASGPKSEKSFSNRWELDWYRFDVCHHRIPKSNSKAPVFAFHMPGSFEGTWAGIFTYAEFGVYAAILSGESPHALHDGAIGQNNQIWKLREYNLFSTDSDCPVIHFGSPHNAFFPLGVLLDEKDDCLTILEANQRLTYERAIRRDDAQVQDARQLRDVILLGEGHSSWGDFQLRGRIRPGDGLFTIIKDYEGLDERSQWLYRGYLFGGKLIGRWRDTMTPMTMIGYEGSFEMSVRR